MNNLHCLHYMNQGEPAEPPARGLAEPVVLFVVLCLTAWFILFAASVANAHDWYPLECCHAQDCAPVDKAETSMPPISIPPHAMGFTAIVPPLPTLTVTTKHGTAPVPANLQRRPSPDGRMHACIRDGKVICLFIPPSM